MRIHDISVTLRPGMVTYPGDPQLRLSRVQSLDDGDAANVSRLDFGVHSGTHVDAPLHFVHGAPDATALPLDVLVGDAWVLDATAFEAEVDGRLELPDGAERVLLRTRNSELGLLGNDEFDDRFVRLNVEGARSLLERRVRLVGVDYLSVGDEAVHESLLSMGVVVVEGLDLSAVEPGRYRLVCLPLKIAGSDGAPARAVLIGEEGVTLS